MTIPEDDTIEFPEPAPATHRASKHGLKAFLAAGAVASAVACGARYRRRRAAAGQRANTDS
ncbi:MAG: hypothetical protein ACJ71Z_06050 [Aeromicrobium sp.]